MKILRVLSIVSMAIALAVPAVALSYDNNEFQQKSRAYSNLAAKAYDEGRYEDSVKYSQLAEENAARSEAYITKMMARAGAQDMLYKAHTRLSWAKEKRAEKFFPEPFATAASAVASADESFASELFDDTVVQSQAAIDALSVVREIIPLPATWVVEKWDPSKDCFWNIAANPAVYGNPFLWPELYKANKSSLKRPSNPNLLMPNAVIAIPSINGEYREGAYDPSIKYEPFQAPAKD